MNKVDLNQDLSIITNVAKLALDNLSDKATECIAHAAAEMIICKETQCEIDIGIGLLYIKVEESNIKYKFIPHKELEELIASSIINKSSPITVKADKALGERIQNAYRCLL